MIVHISDRMHGAIGWVGNHKKQQTNSRAKVVLGLDIYFFSYSIMGDHFCPGKAIVVGPGHIKVVPHGSKENYSNSGFCAGTD